MARSSNWEEPPDVAMLARLRQGDG